MQLPLITQRFLALMAGVVTAVCMTPTMQAQNNPPAPRLFNPQARQVSGRFSPRYMRPTAQTIVNGPAINGGGVVTGPMLNSPVVNGPVINGGQMIYDSGPGVGAPIDHVIVADAGYSSCGGGCDGGCGGGCDGGVYEDCGCAPLYDPRDCGINEDCWFGGLGQIFSNAEYFAGVQAFKHQVFADPQGQQQPENCSFGAHFGFNAGLPLYNLTCGLVSGQVGINSVNSNLEDGVFATGDRQQTFITTGLFRRVDYGLQFGAVADILHEEFLSTLDIVQMRAELSWVWSGGSNFGFRFTENVQDDSGFIGGTFLPRISGQAIDTYRLFYRRSICSGGYIEAYGGKSDERHTIFGADIDIAIGSRTALYAGFNYLKPDNALPLTDNEAWNIQMGISYRPRGRDWYKFYHRPLFKVADNGSMVQSRRP